MVGLLVANCVPNFMISVSKQFIAFGGSRVSCSLQRGVEDFSENIVVHCVKYDLGDVNVYMFI